MAEEIEVAEENIALIVKLTSPVNKMTFRAERLLRLDVTDEELVAAYDEAIDEIRGQMRSALVQHKHLILKKKGVSAIPAVRDGE